MKLSTKGRYGLRAMVDLAVNSNGDHVSLNSIAQRQEISENYLEQVFGVLRKAGLVKSIKGAQGGYALTSKASQIKVGTILRVLEGDLSIMEPISDEDTDSIQYCINKNVWNPINERINDLIDNMYLEDLVNEFKRMKGTLMFYI